MFKNANDIVSTLSKTIDDSEKNDIIKGLVLLAKESPNILDDFIEIVTSHPPSSSEEFTKMGRVEKSNLRQQINNIINNCNIISNEITDRINKYQVEEAVDNADLEAVKRIVSMALRKLNIKKSHLNKSAPLSFEPPTSFSDYEYQLSIGLNPKLPDPKTLKISELFQNIGLGHSTYQGNDVINAITSKMHYPDPTTIPKLAYGPLVKSKYTFYLEDLIKDILNNKDMVHSMNADNHHCLTLSESGKIYDLTEIIENANFSHLFLPEEFHEKYVKFLKEKSTSKPNFGSKPLVFPSEEDFKEKDPEGEHDNLSYAEKLAINIYTSGTYHQINSFMRNDPIIFDNDPLKSLTQAILHSSLCASGLNKVPITTYDTAIRGENLPIKFINDRIDFAKEGKHTFQRGFISTTISKVNPLFAANSSTIFTGGILGQNIQKLSQVPGEGEVLQIPTQVRWKGYAQEGEMTYFHAEPVRTISGLTVKQQEMDMQRMIDFAPKGAQPSHKVSEKKSQEHRAAPKLQTRLKEKPSEQVINEYIRKYKLKKNQAENSNLSEDTFREDLRNDVTKFIKNTALKEKISDWLKDNHDVLIKEMEKSQKIKPKNK